MGGSSCPFSEIERVRRVEKKILQDYPKIEKEKDFAPDPEIITKTVFKTNRTGSGPNGIPFAYYRAMHKKFQSFWPDLIKASTQDNFNPGPNFNEARLVLLPREDGPVTPDRTRPISITNASYRLLMKYWTHEFRDTLSEIVSPAQRALLHNRFIDDCLDDILNAYQQERDLGNKPMILQTDYMKAYDFINRDMIKLMLEKINCPKHLRNIANLALAPSKTTIHINGAKRVEFIAVTGVKQGCPLSPILYILIFDLLVSKLPQC